MRIRASRRSEAVRAATARVCRRVELAAEHRDTLAHADETVPGPVSVCFAGTAVAHLERDRRRLVADDDVGARGPRMFHGVRERLLDDTKGGDVERLRQLARIALDSQGHGQARGTDAVHEPVELCETGLWRQPRRIVRLAQHTEQRPHLVDRLTSGARDRLECIPHVRLRALEHALGSACLHDHHRHVVGDDVVQLARDPSALDRDRGLRLQLALLGELLVREPERK
jgi:hypothetical protein